MAYKADLINNVVAQIHNLPDALNGDVTEVIVGVCEVSTHNLQEGFILFITYRCELGFLAFRHCANALPRSSVDVTSRPSSVLAIFTLIVRREKSGWTCISIY
jgi:hypothetical protein